MIFNKWIGEKGLATGWLSYVLPIKKGGKYLALRVHFLSDTLYLVYIDLDRFTKSTKSKEIKRGPKPHYGQAAHESEYYLKHSNPQHLIFTILFEGPIIVSGWSMSWGPVKHKRISGGH